MSFFVCFINNTKPLSTKIWCLIKQPVMPWYMCIWSQGLMLLRRGDSLGGILQELFIYLFILKFIYLFIFWLCWVFVSVRGPSLVVASGGHSSSRCAALSPSQPLPLRSTGSRRAGSAVVAHGPSRSAACGIFPDQGSNPCPLHWQADSQPLCHQGSPQQELFLNELLSMRCHLKKKKGF